MRLGVNLQVRKHPALAAIVCDVRAWRTGTVVRIDVRLSMGLDPLTGWRADADLAGGGSIHNLGAHALDTLLVVAGATPHQVSAVQRPAGAVLDLATSALLDFRDGPIGTLMVSQSTVGDDVVVDVSGTAGRIRWTGWLAPYRSGSVVAETETATSAAERPRPTPTSASCATSRPPSGPGPTRDPGADEGVNARARHRGDRDLGQDGPDRRRHLMVDR